MDRYADRTHKKKANDVVFKTFIKVLDADNSGSVDYDEFIGVLE